MATVTRYDIGNDVLLEVLVELWVVGVVVLVVTGVVEEVVVGVEEVVVVVDEVVVVVDEVVVVVEVVLVVEVDAAPVMNSRALAYSVIPS